MSTENLDEGWTGQDVLADLDRYGPKGLATYLAQRPALLRAAFDYLPDDVSRFESDVQWQLSRLRAVKKAKELFAEEERGDVEWPQRVNLTDFLAEPDEDVLYRIDKLWPAGGRVVLAAPKKAGKTTTVGNALRSLADGEPFLGRYDTEQAERVLLLDNEMSPSQLRLWLREHGIRNTDAIDLWSLRGRLSTFNILDAAVRARWAAELGPADVLVFDCLRPVLDALGLNEHTDAGRFLEALDELAAEAGISELMVVHHMGHSNERSRGDSRIGDWPDANWKLVPTLFDDGTPDEHGPRYFSALGRDVAEPEAQLGYTHADRRLTVVGGSRREQRFSGPEDAILRLVAEAPVPPSGRDLEALLLPEGFKRDPVRDARKRLVTDGRLIEERRQSKGGGMQYRLPEPGEDVI